jgi:uncharacterized protein (TIGR02145 family)
MKKTTILLHVLVLCLTGFGLMAQTPQMFNYQAVVRDDAGEPIVNDNVTLEISILQGSAEGTPVVIETHQATTNDFGLVNLHIGSILPLEDIDWGTGPYFLEVKLNDELMGVSQLLSVPYALHAASSADAFSGNYDDLEGVPDLSGVVTVADPQTGDMLYFANDSWQKLPVGDEGQMLAIVNGVPAWVTVEQSDITDAEGNVYDVVTIGSQQWLKQNLKTATYNNGDPIISDLDNAAWTETTEGAVGTYPHESVIGIDSEEEMVQHYGRLYNWYAVDDDRGICPTGFRVASKDDWDDLISFLNSEGHAASSANVLKSCRQDGSPLGGDCDTNEHPYWFFNATNWGTDEYGFSALPSGYRSADNGDFLVLTFGKYTWTATEFDETQAYYRMMIFAAGIVMPPEGIAKTMGNSVRCIKE